MLPENFFKNLCDQVTKGYLYLSPESQIFLVADQRKQIEQTGQFWDLHFRHDQQPDFKQLKKFLLACQALQSDVNKERRLQLVYRIGIHTLTIDFKITPQVILSLVLDAVNSAWVDGISKTLAAFCNKVFVALPATFNNTPQAIDGNCHFFAIEHAKTLREIDPYSRCEQLAVKKSDYWAISWEEMDVRFLKDAETRAFLESAYVKNPAILDAPINNSQTFAEYYQARSIPDNPNSLEYPHFPQRPFSIEMHAIQYFHDLQERLKNETEQQILESCELPPILNESQLIAETQKLKQQAEVVSRGQLSFSEAFSLYKPPYDSVPGL